MTEFEQQVLGDLSALKTQMNALLGVGQPGRLQGLEDRVERHEQNVQRMKGVMTCLSVLLTAFHFAIDLFRH